MLSGMALFLRVIELADGRWACRQGRAEIDAHDDRCGAVDHLRRLAAAAAGPTEIFAHPLVGPVQQLAGAAESTPGAVPDPA